MASAENLERILAVKLADLGDVLLTEPALRSLRTAFPDATIDLLTTPTTAALVPLLGDSYHVLEFTKHDFDSLAALRQPDAAARLLRFGRALRGKHYDAVAIFHHLTTPAGALKFRALAAASGASRIAGLDNGRGNFLTHPVQDLGFGVRHTVDYMLAVAQSLGGVDVDPRPAMSGLTQTSRDTGIELPQRFAAVFPTTGPFAPGRNWPATSFADLARLLIEAGLHPVLLGADDAHEPADVINDAVPDAVDLIGQTTIVDLVAILREAEVAIGGDSFPGHLARAVDCPLVSIFGPSNHRAWRPYGSVDYGSRSDASAVVVRKDVPCAPCLYTGYRLGRPAGCPHRTCLLEITAEDVMSAVRSVTGRSQ